MGNHEYCEFCGANDFHMGSLCNKTRREKYEAKKKAIQDSINKGILEAKIVVSKLSKLGIEATNKNAYGIETHRVEINCQGQFPSRKL